MKGLLERTELSLYGNCRAMTGEEIAERQTMQNITRRFFIWIKERILSIGGGA